MDTLLLKEHQAVLTAHPNSAIAQAGMHPLLAMF